LSPTFVWAKRPAYPGDAIHTMLDLILAAALASSTTPTITKPVPPSPIALDGKADQKFGCAVLFVGADEVIRRNPTILAKLSQGDGGKAVGPLLKMMGTAGETVLNAAITEGAARGEKPAEVYRRGVASMASMMIDAPVTKTGDDANEERGMLLFTNCLSLMNE
jgi:hypothetical protein